MEKFVLKIVPDYWDEDLQCISLEQILAVRTLKRQKHLRYAYQNSPFYKKVFDKAGLRPEDGMLECEDIFAQALSGFSPSH